VEKQMIVRIDSELKDHLSRLARTQGKTTSQMVREIIRDYVKERDIGVYIDGLWSRIGAKLTSRGVRPIDINRAIAETRKKRG
jgi:metal-responsive CopG/Arc/MetJ family transcriptional regulator